MNLVIIQAIGDLKYIGSLGLQPDITTLLYYDYLSIDDELKTVFPGYSVRKLEYPRVVKYYSFSELNRIKVRLDRIGVVKEKAKVFYFSNYFDFVTRILIERFLKYHYEIYLIDMDHEHLKNLKSSHSLNALLMRFWIRSIKGTRVVRYGTRDIFEFSSLPNISTLKVDMDRSRVSIDYPKKTIILLEENFVVDDIYAAYEVELQHILTVLVSAGFDIIVKPHPRIGSSKLQCLQDFDLFESRLPLEFFNFGPNVLICGFYTTGFRLLETHNMPISFFRLLSVRVEVDKLQRLRYLQDFDVFLPESFRALNDRLYAF